MFFQPAVSLATLVCVFIHAVAGCCWHHHHVDFDQHADICAVAGFAPTLHAHQHLGETDAEVPDDHSHHCGAGSCVYVATTGVMLTSLLRLPLCGVRLSSPVRLTNATERTPVGLAFHDGPVGRQVCLRAQRWLL